MKRMLSAARRLEQRGKEVRAVIFSASSLVVSFFFFFFTFVFNFLLLGCCPCPLQLASGAVLVDHF